MFNSATFEVAIGVIFVLLLASILCTAIREGIEGWMKTRAAYMEYGIRELLNDLEGKGLVKELFSHPYVCGLFEDGYQPPAKTSKPDAWTSGRNLPSYIPSRNFALALMDIAARGPASKQVVDSSAAIFDLDQVRAGIANLDNGQVQRALLIAIDMAQGDLQQAQKNIEAWFDSSMERVTGWYKRSTQTVLLLIGLVVAVGGNIDVIRIADHLYRNGPARAALVEQAQQAAGDDQLLKRMDYAAAKAEIEGLALPIGWEGPQQLSQANRNAPGGKAGFFDWVAHVPGWLLTALATMLGAPFWFDILSRVMTVRATLKPIVAGKSNVVDSASAPILSVSGAATVLAGVQPRPQSPQDSGDIDMTVSPTVDEELPPARGGVQ